jgi:hypothetical protein
MTQRLQNIIKITNSKNDYYMLTATVHNLTTYKRWVLNLTRADLNLKCPVYSFARFYRNDLSFEIIETHDDLISGGAVANMLSGIEEETDGTLWEKEEDETILNYDDEQPFKNPAISKFYDEDGDSITPCQIILYDNEGNQKDCILSYRAEDHEHDVEILNDFYYNLDDYISLYMVDTGKYTTAQYELYLKDMAEMEAETEAEIEEEESDDEEAEAEESDEEAEAEEAEAEDDRIVQYNFYKIKNTLNNKYVLVSSIFSELSFIVWIKRFNRILRGCNRIFTCEALNFIRKYRGHLEFHTCGNTNDPDCVKLLINAFYSENNTNPNVWRRENDNNIVDNTEYDNIEYDNNVDLLNDNRFRILIDTNRYPILPSQIIIYNYDENYYLDEIENNGVLFRNDSLFLKSLYNENIVPLFFRVEYDAIENPDSDDSDNSDDSDEEENNNDDSDDSDDSDNEDYTQYYEHPEIVELAVLPICKNGFCNICMSDDVGLVHMPKCQCVKENDYTFICQSCQPKLNRCPQCNDDEHY